MQLVIRYAHSKTVDTNMMCRLPGYLPIEKIAPTDIETLITRLKAKRTIECAVISPFDDLKKSHTQRNIPKSNIELKANTPIPVCPVAGISFTMMSNKTQ